MNAPDPAPGPPAPLDDRLADVYRFLYETTRDRGYQPSIVEIGRRFGWTSKNASWLALEAIRRAGWIRTSRGTGDDRPGRGMGRAVRFVFRPDGRPFAGFRDKP